MKDFDALNDELVNAIPELESFEYTMAEGFADIIFSYRLRKGLTQRELASSADVAVKTIHRIEAGSGGIKIETYEKVFNALSIKFEEAFSYFEQKKKAVKIPTMA